MISQATRTPEYFNSDHVVRISGLISCLGIVVKSKSKEGTIACHFDTGKVQTNELNQIIQLLNQQGWKQEDTNVYCHYAPRLNGSVLPETRQAWKTVETYLNGWTVDPIATSSSFHVI